MNDEIIKIIEVAYKLPTPAIGDLVRIRETEILAEVINIEHDAEDGRLIEIRTEDNEILFYKVSELEYFL